MMYDTHTVLLMNIVPSPFWEERENMVWPPGAMSNSSIHLQERSKLLHAYGQVSGTVCALEQAPQWVHKVRLHKMRVP